MSSSSRRILLPPGPGSVSRKRKESSSSSIGDDDFHFLKPAKLNSSSSFFRPPKCKANNQVLAGYMAHEFLTKGTLLGDQKFPPEAVPVQRRRVVNHEQVAVREEYVEVANIVKTEGTHIPGIVNPTQLTRWIHMQM